MIKYISYIYLNHILKNSKYVILLLLIILTGMLSYSPNFKLDASADSLILENDEDLTKYRKTIENYSTKDFIVMTFTPKKGRIFDEDNL